MNPFYYLFPQSCPFCGRSLVSEEDIRFGICRSCIDDLPRVRPPVCRICGKPLVSEIDICLRCREEPPVVQQRSLFFYRDRGAFLLRLYKFQGNRQFSRFLAHEVLCCIQRDYPGYCILPAPANPVNKRRRGWDPVDRIARHLENDLPVFRGFIHRNSGKSQKTLNRKQRRENLEGRLSLRRKPPDQPILLLDDVYTTGATMDALRALFPEESEVRSLALFRD